MRRKWKQILCDAEHLHKARNIPVKLETPGELCAWTSPNGFSSLADYGDGLGSGARSRTWYMLRTTKGSSGGFWRQQISANSKIIMGLKVTTFIAARHQLPSPTEALSLSLRCDRTTDEAGSASVLSRAPILPPVR